MKVRKRPLEVEAIRFDGDNTDDVLHFIAKSAGVAQIAGNEIAIHTLEGTMRARAGDWILRGTRDECYPIKSEIFDETYEVIEDDEADAAEVEA
jgi:hypothetical protein